jgi:hypothetical protein
MRIALQSADLTAAVHSLRDEAHLQFPEVFGGAYWQDDRVKLAFTRDAEAHRDRLMRNFPRPDLVDAVVVDFSFTHLQAVADRVTADSAQLLPQGVDLSTWGVNPAINRVHIGIHHPTPAHFPRWLDLPTRPVQMRGPSSSEWLADAQRRVDRLSRHKRESAERAPRGPCRSLDPCTSLACGATR